MGGNGTYYPASPKRLRRPGDLPQIFVLGPATLAAKMAIQQANLREGTKQTLDRLPCSTRIFLHTLDVWMIALMGIGLYRSHSSAPGVSLDYMEFRDEANAWLEAGNESVSKGRTRRFAHKPITFIQGTEANLAPAIQAIAAGVGYKYGLVAVGLARKSGVRTNLPILR